MTDDRYQMWERTGGLQMTDYGSQITDDGFCVPATHIVGLDGFREGLFRSVSKHSAPPERERRIVLWYFPRLISACNISALQGSAS